MTWMRPQGDSGDVSCAEDTAQTDMKVATADASTKQSGGACCTGQRERSVGFNSPSMQKNTPQNYRTYMFTL